jgi:hypothetical protein
MTVRNTVFQHQGFSYQVMAFSPARVETVAKLRRFEQAFSLLPGTVKERTQALTSPDADGPGWRLRGGVFESLVSGLRVEPRGGWRVAIGTEARDLNEDAEFGLVHGNPDAFAVVIVERPPGTPEEYRERRIAAAGGNWADQERPFTATVAGTEFRLGRYMAQLGGADVHYVFGTEEIDGVMVQILAWHIANPPEPAERAIDEALASIHALTDEARAALEKDLAGRGDPDNAIGPDFALRDGVYRDFTHQFLWRKPPGLWTARAGDEARACDEEARLWIEEARHEIYGMLMVDAPPHDETVATYLDNDEKPTPIRLGAVTALWSDGAVELDDGPFHFALCTVAREDRRCAWIVWTRAAGWEKARAAVVAAVRGLSFPAAKLDPLERVGNEVVDHRLGFRYRPPDAAWSFRDQTPAALEAVGATYAWDRRGRRLIEAVAVCAMAQGQDIDWLLGMMEQNIQGKYGKALETLPERKDAMLAGRPCRHLHWDSPKGTADAFLVVRQRTFYALLTVAPPRARTSLEDVVAGFAFLD